MKSASSWMMRVCLHQMSAVWTANQVVELCVKQYMLQIRKRISVTYELHACRATLLR